MTWILPKQLHTLDCVRDTEALSLDLAEQSQICAQSLFVRSKLSQSRIWSQKWKRDSWTQRLSGRILKPSNGQSFTAEWTSSLEATHVNHSQQQGSDLEKTTQDTFGLVDQLKDNLIANHQESIKLNPRWVETLMGLPVGWVMPSCMSPVIIEPTNCDSSVMESFQQLPSEHLELF